MYVLAQSHGSSTRRSHRHDSDNSPPRSFAAERAAWVQCWARRYNFSRTETQIVELALDGLRREEIATVRRVSVNTVKNQIGSLLAKTEWSSLDEAIAAFYQDLAEKLLTELTAPNRATREWTTLSISSSATDSPGQGGAS